MDLQENFLDIKINFVNTQIICYNNAGGVKNPWKQRPEHSNKEGSTTVSIHWP